MNWGVLAYSSVTADGLYKNGKLLLENKARQDFSVFAKEGYRFLNTAYPKFFKMDELGKLAFLAAEVLVQDQPIKSETDGADIALVLANKTSSIASDNRHYESFKERENYFPSPAVFVYTLPNIMLGELCIRHQITGENTCFLTEQFDTNFMHRYVLDLLKHEGYTYCITGWVDFCDGAYVAHLYLIGKNTSDKKNTIPFDKKITNLIDTRNG